MRGDGDGWVVCAHGHRHWGRFGAAGLLAFTGGDRPAVLLQHRAGWSHFGGTWGVLGGARDSAEGPVETARREAAEESDLDVARVRVTGRWRDDHGGWAYDTVLAAAPERLPAAPAGGESVEVAWFDAAEVDALPLHPGFAAVWPRLRPSLRRGVLVVDVANVMGARPDGWWRDRASAAARLLRDVATATVTGLEGSTGPGGLPLLTAWHPEVVAVLEGAAAPAAQDAPVPVVVAPYGDDAVVAAVAGVRAGDPTAAVVVVTADRDLRRRCTEAGATVAGPRWLLARLPGAAPH